MDKAAVGFDYKSQAEKHDSQKGELGGGAMQQAVSGLELGTMPTGAVGHCAWFFATCCMNGGKAVGSCWVPTACSNGMGQVRKAIARCMTAGESSG